MGDRPPRVDLAALLAAVEAAPPVGAAEAVRDELGRALGATDVSLLLADLSGKALVRLGQEDDASDGTRTQGGDSAERVPIAGTAHGRALTEQDTQVESSGGVVQVLAPVTNRGEAIGVLEVDLPGAADDETVTQVERAAHALAYVVIVNRRFTDLYEWGQRSAPLSLAAEIQRRLLPGSYTCEAGQATIAGWLQPAADAAGDTFDYSLERGTLHLSLTDAVGHEVQAALIATAVVGALRNTRRVGAGLEEQATAAGDALVDLLPGIAFATGQLVRIDLRSGAARVVNAGHPHPLRLRDGAVSSVELEADPPLGTFRGHAYRVQELPLEPGDRLVFLSDGVLERNASDLDVRALVRDTAGEHPRHAVQQLMQALLETTGGDLKDDATVLCVDWHGPARDERSASGGADR